MTNARTICGSGDSAIRYPQRNKPSAGAMSSDWQDIFDAERVAKSSYRAVDDCAQADLIVKITVDTIDDSVSLLVIDGDSGDLVFSEKRGIQDERSDLIRAAKHFRDAVKNARYAAQAEQSRLADEYRRQEKAEAAKREQQQCQSEFDSLKQNIVAFDVQHIEPTFEIKEKMEKHNSHCPNSITFEAVQQEQKAELRAKADREQAEKERQLQQKRTAQLDKERSDAFAAYTHLIADAPFVPPGEGWTHETRLGSVLWYIILPGKGFTSGCHFVINESHPALDCLGSEGRNDYVPVVNNGRTYLLKAKRINAGEHAASVKDKGSTLCLRQAGCYRVLAELRQEPTGLPDTILAPIPTDVTAIYSSDDLEFRYPQNWKAQEMKDKDNVVTQVTVAPPQAHLANWVTHGFFIGHVSRIADAFPKTLDGAYEQFSTYERSRGFVIANSQSAALGDAQGKIATYTGSSIFRAEESGWVAVVKDKTDGYYYLLMFYPSNDDSALYARTFTKILETFKFKH